MSFGFEMTLEEEREFQLQLQRDKEEFEALNLDYYKDFEYSHFTEFISSMEHLNKSYGTDYFVNEYVTEDKLDSWRLHESLYVVGFVEYLCDKNGIKLPDYVSKFNGVKLDKLLFHKGVFEMIKSGVYKCGTDAYINRLPYFSKYNLILSTVDEVVKNCTSSRV